MNERGRETRDRLTEVAEQLFGDRGVAAVSLREINTVAGQRNTAALHYHFKSRAGLIQAIAEKHRPELARRQNELCEPHRRGGGAPGVGDLRGLVEVLIRPWAEYLEVGRGARAFVKICAQLLPEAAGPIEVILLPVCEAGDAVAAHILALVAADVPAPLAAERLTSVLRSTLHVLADRARLMDALDSRRIVSPLPLFLANVVDMVSGALAAPVSGETRALL